MPGNPRRRNGWGGTVRVEALLLCAVVAACAAVLAGFAWARSTVSSTVVGYRQLGSLTYSAPATPTSIYGAGGVTTGQPVYQHVVATLQVSYAYQFETASSTRLHGTEQLVAKMSNGQGLTKAAPLQGRTRFAGDRFRTTAVLRLATLQAMAAAFDQIDTNASSASYTVSISPQVEIHGMVGAAALKAGFDQAAKFTYGAAVLSPASAGRPGTAVATSATGTKQVGQPISSASSGSVYMPGARPTSLFAGLTVLNARIVGTALLAAAVIAAMVLGWPLLKEAASDEERVRIATKFGSQLIEVAALPHSPVARVELTSFDGLLRVSRQLECPLLHLRSAGFDEYAVVDNGTVYLYRVDDSSESAIGRVVSARTESPRHAVAEPGITAKRAKHPEAGPARRTS